MITWISTKDMVPEEGIPVLVAHVMVPQENGNETILVAKMVGMAWKACDSLGNPLRDDSDSDMIKAVTRWAKLPPTPTEQSKSIK